jgi:hypothetical protein
MTWPHAKPRSSLKILQDAKKQGWGEIDVSQGESNRGDTLRRKGYIKNVAPSSAGIMAFDLTREGRRYIAKKTMVKG